VGANNGVTVAMTAPTANSTVNMASPIPLAATVSLAQGSAVTVAAVKFYANGQLIGTGSNSGGVSVANSTATQARPYHLSPAPSAVRPPAYAGNGNQAAQALPTPATVSGSQSASDPTPIPVNIAPPHLSNPDAGTLPGSLAVNNDGAATYSIPLAVPPGTGGM